MTEGLKIGDVIITEGAGLIRDGMPVTRKEESQAQAPAGEQTAVNK